jgi:hypothetical protein
MQESRKNYYGMKAWFPLPDAGSTPAASTRQHEADLERKTFWGSDDGSPLGSRLERLRPRQSTSVCFVLPGGGVTESMGMMKARWTVRGYMALVNQTRKSQMPRQNVRLLPLLDANPSCTTEFAGHLETEAPQKLT